MTLNPNLDLAVRLEDVEQMRIMLDRMHRPLMYALMRLRAIGHRDVAEAIDGPYQIIKATMTNIEDHGMHMNDYLQEEFHARREEHSGLRGMGFPSRTDWDEMSDISRIRLIIRESDDKKK